MRAEEHRLDAHGCRLDAHGCRLGACGCRRMRLTLLAREQRALRAELMETHGALAQAQGECEEVRERGRKVLANVLAQQEDLITRQKVKAFVRKLGAEVSSRELDELFTAQESGARHNPTPWRPAKY